MALVVKNLPANAGDIRDASLIPGSRRSPGGRHDNELQCSCLENRMDSGAWWVPVHRVAKSQTQLKQWHACRQIRLRTTYSYILLYPCCRLWGRTESDMTEQLNTHTQIHVHLSLCIYYVLSCSVVSDSLPHGLRPTRLLSPWGFFRQEYWSGLHCPPLGDRPDPGIKPTSHGSCIGRWVLYH